MTSSIDLYGEISKANAEKKAQLVKFNGIISVLDKMSEEDRSSLLKALYDETIDGTVIHKVLQANGWEISYDQVRRFRKGSCKIPDRYKNVGNR